MNFIPKKHILSVTALLLSLSILAQKEKNTKYNQQGKLYFYWGWNGADYTDSDISFRGNDYSFTLSDIKANDRQSNFSFDKYFNPGNITIPQYNFRVGYYFKPNWDISFGIDHMKYVLDQNQVAKISGTINAGTPFDGAYNNDDIPITKDFLQFEHTNGLNFVNIELRYSNRIYDANKVQFNYLAGGGGGILYPKTNVTLLGRNRHDDFNVAGYGIDAVVGINITFFKRFFIQSELKGGWINLPNVRTTADSADSAEQDFFFLQRNIVFGGIFNLTKTSKIKKTYKLDPIN